MAKSLQEKIYGKLSYTNQDYNSILNELIEMFNKGEDSISQNWNNISEADPLFILMSLMAAHKDILNYMVDYRTLESFMATARERASMTRIANSYGYKIPSYRAGRALAQLGAVQGDGGATIADNFSIESFTQLRDEDSVPWAYIGPNLNNLKNGSQIEVFQGVVMSTELSFDNVDARSKTHILTAQNISIGNSYSAQGVSKLTVNGEDWTEVENLNVYTGTDVKVYELNVDPQGITYIKFHQNTNLSLYVGVTFTFKYLITQGALATSISDLSADIQNGGNNYVGIFSPVASSLYIGENPYVAQQIKEDFKNYFASNGSLITVNDIKNEVLSQREVPGITKCLVIDKQVSTSNYLTSPFTGHDLVPEAIPEGIVSIYVMKGDYPNASFTQASELELYLRNFISTSINTLNINQTENGGQDATAKPIYVKVHGSSEDANIKQLIADYVNGKNFGDRIFTSDIKNMLDSSEYSYLLDEGYAISLSLDNTNFEFTYVSLDYFEYPALDLANITFI